MSNKTEIEKESVKTSNENETVTTIKDDSDEKQEISKTTPEEIIKEKLDVPSKDIDKIENKDSLKTENKKDEQGVLSPVLPKLLSSSFTRNQSDILPSLRELPRDQDPSLMIFSHKGLPTKKYYRRSATPKSNSDEKILNKNDSDNSKISIPTLDKDSKNPSVSRNILTGIGVNSQDEFKHKSTKRRDGNPVLGVGYDEPTTTNNTGRVPPGGYSNGLW